MWHIPSLPESPPQRASCRLAVGVLFCLLASAPVGARGQPGARRPTEVRSVVVLPFALMHGSAASDSTATGYGIAALLESELTARGRIRVASRASAVRAASPRPALNADVAAALRARGASYAVLGEVLRMDDSVRVIARLLGVRDTVSRMLDTLTVTSGDIPTLVDDLADAVTDAVAPNRGTTRGGPLFRPPRPPVPFAAMTLYSRAVAARAAGDPDTAAKLLRQAATVAPQWEQPKRDLAALRRRS